MDRIHAIIKASRSWNDEILSLKAKKANVQMSLDVQTIAIELSIILIAAALFLLIHKMNNWKFKDNLNKAREMMEELELMDELQITSKFIDKSMIMVEETNKMYKEILHAVKMNHKKEKAINISCAES
ncbi:hypothetical protein L9F63_004529 [Diploptera punctata]|uniref:Uncharacterized protein n=1 Tax=Diploptera punctata TaxID=6984 RepID=A0AAD8E7A9_DIPPU|nr:hypothetical protein L9F63_004529 [Diploptera punctata]